MDAVQCYMLRCLPQPSSRALITVRNAVDADPCSDKPWHRAEFPIDESYSLDEVRRMLPVKCMYCGRFEFTEANSDVCIAHSTRLWINPMTHVTGPNIFEVAAPGAMWFCDWLIEDGPGSMSNEYRQDWYGKRDPIEVMLPNRACWCVDAPASDAKDGHGWRVTGEPPFLTAYPSINQGQNRPDGWHGWLRNGVLTL